MFGAIIAAAAASAASGAVLAQAENESFEASISGLSDFEKATLREQRALRLQMSQLKPEPPPEPLSGALAFIIGLLCGSAGK